MSEIVSTILRSAASAMSVPVQIILILFMVFALFSIGWVLVEYFTEHRKMKAVLEVLLDDIRSEEQPLEKVITESSLLDRQKNVLIELTHHASMSSDLRASLADSLVEKESDHYDSVVKITDVVSKLAPMFGLLGTLIPLGPGLIALGQGDTYVLSTSLLTAFDTTIAGLLAAAVCLVISTIRKRWYSGYMSDLETLADCVLEVEERSSTDIEFITAE